MVLGRNGKVFHAGSFGSCNPLFCIEQNRVKFFVEAVVIVLRYLPVPAPAYFCTAQCNRAKMNKHAEAFMHKIVDDGCWRFCGLLCAASNRCAHNYAGNNEQFFHL